MDFFEAQARARQRSARLLLLFALAVAGMIAAGYFAALGLQRLAGLDPARLAYGDLDPRGQQLVLWQPDALGLVAGGTLLVVGLASLFKWLSFSAGGGAVAESVGGRRVDPHTTEFKERRLLNVVEEMAIASGVPMPAVFILDGEPAINAFAAGLTTADAAVAVTRGTLEKLNREELQGVIGHEFSHILNGDMRLNLRLAAIIFGILAIGLAGRGLLWRLRHTRVRGGSRDKNGGGLILVLIGAGVALFVIGYVGYFFGRMIQAAVSRQREFLADASAVQFTRNASGLGGALKKIGGYALGSTMQSSKSAAIGHFFFAQGFRSSFGGLWATHPPLDERIRAIEPRFDGQFFEPAQIVDVARESFVTAGLAPAGAAPPRLPVTPAAAIAAFGTLPPGAVDRAHALLDATPDRLRLAAQTPREARLLAYGLLLGAEPALRARQRHLVATRDGTDTLRCLDELEPALLRLRPEHKLPLLQIALPALRQIPAAALDRFLGTLDELVHADGAVSPFEFALQKLLARTLALGRAPEGAAVRYHAFNAVAPEISAVLSAVARSASPAASAAERAFAAGLSQLQGVAADFRLGPAGDFAALDAALGKIAAASPPIKQRTLAAAAHAAAADGQIAPAEAELLRAIAAALDVPMPPLGVGAA
jgi:Zn-dependent protease with chaperone function